MHETLIAIRDAEAKAMNELADAEGILENLRNKWRTIVDIRKRIEGVISSGH